MSALPEAKAFFAKGADRPPIPPSVMFWASPPSTRSATTCLFERFVSQERKEPPDIDVDFEHERREEVIQWVYNTYGRHRAALCSTVIRYRAKGALRDVGKALGLPEDMIGMLSKQVWGWSEEGVEPKHAAELNLNLTTAVSR